MFTSAYVLIIYIAKQNGQGGKMSTWSSMVHIAFNKSTQGGYGCAK